MIWLGLSYITCTKISLNNLNIFPGMGSVPGSEKIPNSVRKCQLNKYKKIICRPWKSCETIPLMIGEHSVLDTILPSVVCTVRKKILKHKLTQFQNFI